MILRKIVDWIAESKDFMPSNENNGYCIEEPEKIVIKDKNVKNNNHSSSSSVTSVVNFSFAPQNNFDDNTLNDLKENKNEFEKSNRKRCATQIQGISEQVKQDKTEKVVGDYESKKTSSDKNTRFLPKSISTGFLPVINETCEVQENIGDDCPVVSKPSIITSNNTSHLSPFAKENSSFKPYASDTKSHRNVWTQSETKLGKRRQSSIMKHSHKHTHPQIPEYEKKIRSFPTFAARHNNNASVSFKEKPDEISGSVIYGALYVFGCNGVVPEHLVEKMSSKYILRKRRNANGIKESFSYVRSNSESLCDSPAKHIISYPLSNNRSVVVGFKHDSLSDMFQIGRDEKSPVDFRVVDIKSSEEARNGVSRLACRIHVRRDGNHEARVYAAAFDTSQKIFMGENGIPSSFSGKMDGFTTNGVLIMHPGKGNPGVWREVSVSGYIYPLRTSEIDISKRPRLLEESNVLQDGTMIDLCGVTLVWRSPEGLNKIPDEEHLRRLLTTLHRTVPECELLKQESKLKAYEQPWAAKKAFVYTSCGHVIGLKLSKPPVDLQKWSCPVCRVIGPITELKIGIEPGFYVDGEFPSHAFKPCGHAASEETVKYWSSTEIPIHRTIQDSHCPFCGVKLNFIKKYVKLIIPTP